MKHLIRLITISLFACTLNVQAQQMSDKERLALTVWVPDNEGVIPPAAVSILENKLMQIATQNGITGSTDVLRFILTANMEVLTKDITATAPVMQAFTLNVNMYIADGIDGKAFSSYSTTVKGVGENETKAYLSALKNMKTNNPAYQSFIAEGKSKIISYFNAQCDFIIKNAKTLADMNQFDEAIWNLTSIPDVCPECWNKANIAAKMIFKQKIDFECKEKINMANNCWNAGQSWDAANQAGAILSTIDPNSSCVGEIKPLAAKIEKRIREVDKREWKYFYDFNIGLTRDWIKAYRDVGVAWGNGQRRTIIYRSYNNIYNVRRRY